MTLARALVRALAAEGIDTVFGLVGGGVEDVALHVTAEPGMRYVKVRHEEAAVGMADGYARATGGIGVVILDGLPGIANASAAMLAARMGNSPVLVVFAHNPLTSRYDFYLPRRQQQMIFDQGKLLDATIGAWDLIRGPDTLSEDVARAVRRLRLGRGPLALGVHGQSAEMPGGWTYTPHGRSTVAARPPAVPLEIDVAAIAHRLRTAERPVLLVGRGAWQAQAHDALIALADRAGALIATSLLASGWLREYPYTVGLAGGFATNPAFHLLSQSDLVIGFGTSMNDYTMGHGRLFPAAALIQVDTDAGAIGEYAEVELGVLADVRLAAERITQVLEPLQRPQWRSPAIAERIAQADRFSGLELHDGTDGANPRAIVDAVDRLAPSDRLLVVDIGIFQGLPTTYVGVPTPGDLVLPWQLGRVGVGLPVAAGAALARPDQLVILFVGDGGIMAATNTLDTLRSAAIPLLVIVLDDGGFGAERRSFELLGHDGTAVDSYETPDLAAIAMAYDMDAYTVRSTAQMEKLLTDSDFAGRTTLIHVVIDQAFRPIEMDRALYDPDAPRPPAE